MVPWLVRKLLFIEYKFDHFYKPYYIIGICLIFHSAYYDIILSNESKYIFLTRMNQNLFKKYYHQNEGRFPAIIIVVIPSN